MINGNEKDYLFLKACRGEEVPRCPVWFMRQAGRYMKEYQKIRSKFDFLTLCKTPEIAAEVTLQPVDMLGVDAAILFSDILVVVEAMGLEVRFLEKEGPVISEPIRNEEGMKNLFVPDIEESLEYVMNVIKLLRKKLEGRVPLIGFSGAPFTLATYMIEGGSSKNFLYTKSMFNKEPALFLKLMEKISQTVSYYLKAQIKAGAQALQIFDTWAGILSPDDFVQFELPFVKQIISYINEPSVPIIYFVNTCCGLLEQIKTSGADVIGIDWRISMSDAVQRLGKNFVVQGNLDPCALFSPVNKIEEQVKKILENGHYAKGHIFNVGHGILPQTPVENVKAVVEMVHRFGVKE
jgi:uroporphyrinogen decarboxylase